MITFIALIMVSGLSIALSYSSAGWVMTLEIIGLLLAYIYIFFKAEGRE